MIDENAKAGVSVEAAPEAVSPMRGRMVSGVFWRGTGQIGAQVIHLVAVAVLARLLTPAEFGLAGMAAILTGLVARLGDLGLGSAVIQRSKLSQEQMSSVHWTVVVLGFVAWLIAVAVSPLFAEFMREPRLVAVISVSALAFVITSLGNTHRFLLLRDLRFKQMAVVELAAAVLYAASTVVLALRGLGVWSLVIGHLVQAGVAVVAVWFISHWRPRFVLDIKGIRGLLSFGAKAWGGGLLAYAQESGDYFVIGRALGPAPLGYYTMAFNLANVPRTKLGSVVSMVAFAGFSRIQEDSLRVRRGFLRVIRYISLVSFPLLTGMLILASEFIVVVYGEKWVPSVMPLRLLSAAAIPASLTAAMPAVMLAKDRAGLHFRIALVQTAAFFAFIIVGVQWGTVGVAGALMLHAVVFFAVNSYYVLGIVEAPLSAYLAAARPAAVGALVMAAAVALARLGLIGASVGPFVSLMVCVLLGMVVYLGVLFLMRIPELSEVREMLRQARRQRRVAAGEADA